MLKYQNTVKEYQFQYLYAGFDYKFNACQNSSMCLVPFALHVGLPDRHHHQRQHQLLPHVQEDVSQPACDDGAEPRGPSRSRGLGPPVQHRLPQRLAAHVRCQPPRHLPLHTLLFRHGMVAALEICCCARSWRFSTCAKKGVSAQIGRWK